MHFSITVHLFVIFFCISLATENVFAAPSLTPTREKRSSPMEMVMTGVGMGVDLMQQGVAGGHAGSTSIGTIEKNRRCDIISSANPPIHENEFEFCR